MESCLINSETNFGVCLSVLALVGFGFQEKEIKPALREKQKWEGKGALRRR